MITRRNFIAGGAAGAVGGLPGPPFSGIGVASAAYASGEVDKALDKMRGRTLVIATWGGTYQEALREAWFKPFSERYGVKIIEDGPPFNAKVVAMVESGKITWDICDFATYRIDPLGLSGNLEELDFSIIDKSRVPDEFVFKWGIGNCTYSTIVAYRSDMIAGEPPSSVAALWDLKRYPGKRALHDEPIHNLPFALIALGVPKDQIYPLTEDKIAKAFAKLDEIKEHVIWWTIGAQSPQLLANKEVILAEAYSNRFDELIAQGVPIKLVWDGAQTSGDGWAITKGSPNKDLAMLFIAWATLPENNVAMSKYITMGPVNQDAVAKVPPERRQLLPSAYTDRQVVMDAKWWGPNFDPLVQRWKAWRLKG
jgi:putative spermidine/putrescine transport system substrate-binding protein